METALVARGTSWTTWAVRAQTQATVVLFSAGSARGLTYVHCHREERRRLLLARALGEYEVLGMVVAVKCQAEALVKVPFLCDPEESTARPHANLDKLQRQREPGQRLLEQERKPQL